jgi:hypothetical protein
VGHAFANRVGRGKGVGSNRPEMYYVATIYICELLKTGSEMILVLEARVRNKAKDH